MTSVVVKTENGEAKPAGEKAGLENVNGNGALKKEPNNDVKKEESSDDDDVPLSELKRKDSEKKTSHSKIKKENEKNDESSDDDDIPLSELKRKDSQKEKIQQEKALKRGGVITTADFERRKSPRKRPRTNVSSYVEEEDDESGDDDESSSDDDIPLSELKKKDSRNSAKKTPTKKKTPAKKKTATKKRKTTSSSKKIASNGSSKKKKSSSKSNSNTTTSSKNGPYSWEIHRSQKHELAEKILLRWHYCMKPWPQEKEDQDMPQGFIHCGFKGVFMGFRGDVCGEIIDNRSRVGIPSLNALVERPAKELKELLLVGLAKQKETLKEHEKENSKQVFNETCKALEKELKEAQKLNPDRIEKDHAKVTKSKKKR